MDDDIRDRFRGVSRREPTPTGYGRQARPVRPATPSQPQQPAPKQIEKSDWPSALGGRASENSPPHRTSTSDRPQKPAKKPRKKLFKRRTKRKKKSKKKLIIFLLLITLLVVAGGIYYSFVRSNKNDKQFQQELTTPQAATGDVKPTGTIRFIAIGDNLAFESINNAAKQADGSFNYLPMMDGFKTFFDKSDIRLCNETTPGGGDKDGLAISAYPTFNAPLEWSTGFAGLGCNVINLASEHINDKGQPAIDTTLNTWENSENILAYAGANRSAEEQAKIRYFTVKSTKFAYLAYTTSSLNNQTTPYGVNIYSDEIANKQIEEARKNAQLVIVSMNWGTKDSNDVNADQDRIAQNLANQNVDVVVGGGPNALQPAKILSGKNGHQTLVWFSLGNFLNSQLPVNNLIGGMAVMDFDVATQKLNDPKLMPVYMHYEWTAAQKSSSNLNARHGFKMWPLDLASEALASSQNGTTVEVQTTRITDIITKFAPIKIIKSTEF